MKKNESILWKLNSIRMKILNNIASNLNWIEEIRMQIGAKSIENWLSSDYDGWKTKP
jgi:hypothetical protein